ELLGAGYVIQKAVREATGWEWAMVAGEGGSGDRVAVTIGVDEAMGRREGYRLSVSEEGIEIVGSDPAGAFYGAQTLAQLIRQSPKGVGAVRIEDWPDFPARGVMLDISRDKVPTMQTLYALVDELAAMKVNQLQLYTEHTFAYRGHPEVWAQASPMTGQEILELDRYCRERFIELVPNQNSFGHMERWLKHPRYLPLAEAPDGFDFPWGRHEGPFSLCPTDPGSVALIESLYDELLPHFGSRMFNVGCDETFDLGQGRSKAECEKRGKERVYLDFLLKIHKRVKDRGRRMQFWGDIILHRPELISELPDDLIAMEWGYEANHPFDQEGEMFHKAGVPYYVCPGTSSWLSIAGRTENAIGNLKNAAENGLKHGAIGYLNTDWGDLGHLQYLPVSYLGFAAGAAYSWCWEANRELPIAEAVSRHVFRDRAGVMGQVAYELGNVYGKLKRQITNSTLLFWGLVGGPMRAERKKELEQITGEEYEAVENAIEAAMGPLERARMDRGDAALIGDEFRNAAAMLRHACRRGRMGDRDRLREELSGIIGEHRRLWVARNRIGGLAESTRRLEARLDAD
ncbi:MAG: beta-N-acetylhexosaminidase, partial [Bacillota bacterium]